MGDLQPQLKLAEAAGPPLTGSPQALRLSLDQATERHARNIAVVSLYQSPLPEPSTSFESAQKHLTWTYEQLDQGAGRIAASLSQKGVGKGMRVAVLISNSAEWALLFWATVKLSATFVPLDPRAVSRAAEIHHYLQVVRPAVLVVANGAAADLLQRNNASDLEDIAIKLTANPHVLVQSFAPLASLLQEPVPGDTLRNAISEAHLYHQDDDVVLIVFTSGTSSFPKACPHTNRTIWAVLAAGRSLSPTDASDRLVQHLPPSHVFAVFAMIHCWCAGATVAYPSEAFDATATLDAIEEVQCTQMPGKISCSLYSLDT